MHFAWIIEFLGAIRHAYARFLHEIHPLYIAACCFAPYTLYFPCCLPRCFNICSIYASPDINGTKTKE